MPQDLALFLVAATAVAVCAQGARESDSPNWAVRFYRRLFRVSLLPPLRRYARDKTSSSRREQFLAAWLLRFFLVFGVGSFLLPSCGRISC